MPTLAWALIGAGAAAGLVAAIVFVVAEAAERLTNWVWNKFTDWYLCRYGSGE